MHNSNTWCNKQLNFKVYVFVPLMKYNVRKYNVRILLIYFIFFETTEAEHNNNYLTLNSIYFFWCRQNKTEKLKGIFMHLY